MRTRQLFKKSLVASLFVAVLPAHAVGGEGDVRGEPATTRVLSRLPTCVSERLGAVSIEVGSKMQDSRSGTSPSRASYRRAFEKLSDAVREKGGDAVVLRGHEAAYVSNGNRKVSRPSYLKLKGSALKLDQSATACKLELIDPEEFAAKARRKPRESVRKDAGVSF